MSSTDEMTVHPADHAGYRAAAGWWMVVVFCFAALTSYIDRLILSVLVDPIRQSLLISDSQVSVLQGAAFAMIYASAGMFLGRLVDRRRRLTILMAGSILWCIGTAGCGFAPGFWSLFACRFLVGVGEAALYPAAISMIADAVPQQRRGTALGILTIGTVGGGPAAVAFGGILLQVAQTGYFSHVFGLGNLAPWRQVLVVIGAAGLLVPALLLTLREPVRKSRPSADISLKALAARFVSDRRTLIPLYVGMALLAVGDFGLLSWLPSLLSRKFHLRPDAIGLWVGVIAAVGGICGSVGGGLLADWARSRGGLRGQLRLSAAAATAAALGALLVSGPTAGMAVAGLGIWSFASIVAFMAAFTALQAVIPDQFRGIGTSLVSLCDISLGLGVGPTLIAVVTERVFADPVYVGYAMSVVTLPAALVAGLLFITTKSPAQPQYAQLH